MNQKISVIAVRQPYANLLIRPTLLDPLKRKIAIDRGYVKDVENRSRRSNYRGELFIHATKTHYQEDYEWCFQLAYKLGFAMSEIPNDYKLGGIVGSVQMIDCLPVHKSPFYIDGNFAYVMENPLPIKFTPIRGFVGIFKVDRPKLEYLT